MSVMCGGCFQVIKGTYVKAFGSHWHDKCFKCGKCGYPIRDARYVADGETPFHAECLALLKGELCGRCLRPITGTVTSALGQKWHPDCFLCAECRLPILTSQFTSRGNRAYHIHCNLRTKQRGLQSPLRTLPLFIASPSLSSSDTVGHSSRGHYTSDDSSLLGFDMCHACHQIIRDEITTAALGKTWHPRCFICGRCGRPIGENKFRAEGLVPYHINCKLADLVRICHGCYRPIDGADVTEAMGDLWHPECFKCAVCNLRIHGTEFTRDGALPVHLHCKRLAISPPRRGRNSLDITNSSKMTGALSSSAATSSSLLASNCQKCKQPVLGPACHALGVVYHPDCFRCGNCNLPVLDAEFLYGVHPFHKHCISSLAPGTAKLSTSTISTAA